METNKSVTAVEWLYSKWSEQCTLYLEDLEQAKAMEKEQIVNAHHEGYRDGVDYKPMTEEQYYNETYEKNI